MKGCTKFDESPDMSVSFCDSLFFSPTIRGQIICYLGDGSGMLHGFADAQPFTILEEPSLSL